MSLNSLEYVDVTISSTEKNNKSSKTKDLCLTHLPIMVFKLLL